MQSKNAELSRRAQVMWRDRAAAAGDPITDRDLQKELERRALAGVMLLDLPRQGSDPPESDSE